MSTRKDRAQDLAPSTQQGREALEALTEGTPEPAGPSLGARLRTYLLTGLVVVGPVTITLYIARYVIDVVDRWVKPYIPDIYNPDKYLPFDVPGFGLIFVIVALTMIGALAANLIGRSIISASEMMLDRTPIVSKLYRATKQVFEGVVTASAADPKTFQKVALMEFPSKGIWAIVFMTGEAASPIKSALGDSDLVSVFMPTHLIPPSGFVVFVPRASVVPVDMSVEDAAKIVISAGLVNPGTQRHLADLAETTMRRTNRPTAPPVKPAA
jgi:uncharacterized membrane protein